MMVYSRKRRTSALMNEDDDDELTTKIMTMTLFLMMMMMMMRRRRSRRRRRRRRRRRMRRDSVRCDHLPSSIAGGLMIVSGSTPQGFKELGERFGDKLVIMAFPWSVFPAALSAIYVHHN